MKTNFKLQLCILIAIFFMLTSCSKSKNTSNITIFAAASTTDLITDIAHIFEEDTGSKVKINTASSGTLARQLEQGAKADIYISASAKWMEYTDTLGLVEIKQPFLKNRLVLISHKDSEIEPFEMDKNSNLPSLFTSRLSMGDPAHVPAGQYAFEALNSLGWYDDLKDRLLPAADVRAALSVVEFDEADFGIVYETDALKSNKVKIISFFPEDSYSPVLYFCALLKTKDTRGRAFYTYLTSSSQVEELYTKYGFNLWN